MAKLLLHIGAHKTGTSFLQGTFHRNRRLLERHGIHYPNIGPNNAHHALGAVWLGASDIPDSFFGTAGPEGLWTRFLRDYAERDGTVFLSAENFCRAQPFRVDMEDLARRLEPFESVQVVYTMRRQTELVQSLWMQVAKSRQAPTLRTYVERALTEHLGGGTWIDHNKVYDHMLEGFAPEQIVLADYAQLRAAPGGVLGSFLRLMQSDLDTKALSPAPASLSNVSPEPLPLYVASLICDRQVPPPELVAQVEAVIRPDRDQSTNLLTRREDGLIRRTFRPLNASLVRRVRPVQPGFNFQEDNPIEGAIYRDDLQEKDWARIAGALYRAAPPRISLGRKRPIWTQISQRFGRG